MQNGDGNTTIASTQRVEVYNQQGIGLAGPGPTTVLNWQDAQNGLARFGSLVRIEVTGAVQIDSLVIRGAYTPGGPYVEATDNNPIPPGQAREVQIPGAWFQLPPPLVWLAVTNANGPTVIGLRIINGIF